jgi:hypothetical protein
MMFNWIFFQKFFYQAVYDKAVTAALPAGRRPGWLKIIGTCSEVS